MLQSCLPIVTISVIRRKEKWSFCEIGWGRNTAPVVVRRPDDCVLNWRRRFGWRMWYFRAERRDCHVNGIRRTNVIQREGGIGRRGCVDYRWANRRYDFGICGMSAWLSS